MELQLRPKVLTWARERARLSPADLALKMKRKEEQVLAWERDGQIKFNWAEKLAHVTHTPYGCLFLSEPMEEKLPGADFRTLKDKDLQRPSPDLIDVLDSAVLRQDWFREYLVVEGEEPLKFVGSLSVDDDPMKAAQTIKAEMQLHTSLRAEAASSEDAMRVLTGHIEEQGILVMRSGVVGNNPHRKLNVDEFRSFALSDEYAPVIFVNGADFAGAQVFTLMHELVHVWVGESGVSNLEATYAPDHRVEHFCNTVAAELLVPEVELRAMVNDRNGRTDDLAPYTRYFKVSSVVVLRRLHDIGLLSKPVFFERYRALESAALKKSDGGGNFYLNQKARSSARFSRALIASAMEGRTLWRDAYKLLGIPKHATFVEYARQLGYTITT